MIFNVKKDIEKNRLYIKIGEKADISFIKKTFYTVRSFITELKPGYGVIIDWLECNFIYIDAIPIYKNIIKNFVETNAGEIVKVVDSNSLIFGQINNLTKNTQSYNEINVQTVLEAEEKLDSISYRKGLRLKVKNLTARFKYLGNNYNFVVIDISKSGCLIKCENISIDVGEIITIYLLFKGLQELKTLFHVKSEVVRSDGATFAVKFVEIDDDFTQALHNRLSSEICREES